jgi:hypothetical protein
MGWRDHWKVHPAADLFPLMSESELRELGEDIKANGLISPLIKCEGKLLGRNRLDAMELVGLKLHVAVNEITPGDPYDYVLSANLHRRHLTGEQKRELIAKVLKAKPEASNRKIAKQTKADDKTVAKVRRDLESGAEIPHVEKTEGSDGKKYKAKKKTPRPTPAEIERDRKECVALYQKMIEAEKEAARATGSAEVSIEQRQAENAALDRADGNPIWLAWCVATPKQRREFVYLGWSDIEKVRAAVDKRSTTNAAD